jgi:hypothetical protein
MKDYETNPWGEEREDLRTGYVVAATLTPWRKKGSAALNPKDYVPFKKKERPRVMSVREGIERVAIFTAMMGGEDRRKRK